MAVTKHVFETASLVPEQGIVSELHHDSCGCRECRYAVSTPQVEAVLRAPSRGVRLLDRKKVVNLYRQEDMEERGLRVMRFDDATGEQVIGRNGREVYRVAL